MKKTFYYLFMSLFLAVMSVGFTACSSDDDDNGDNPGGEIVESGWVENGNTITYTASVASLYTMKWTLTFDDNDLCTRSICESTFATSSMANEFYNEYEGEGYLVTKSGNTVTIDYTTEHQGLSKTLLKSAIEAMTSGM